MGDITKNFSYSQFTASGYAARHKIDNSLPNETIRGNVRRMATEVLQPLVDATGWKVLITSGYRCDAVNRGVNGVQNSRHLIGCAADIKCYTQTGKVVALNLVKSKIQELKCPADQFIFYTTDGHYFMHVGIPRNGTPVKTKTEVYYDPHGDGADTATTEAYTEADIVPYTPVSAISFTVNRGDFLVNGQEDAGGISVEEFLTKLSTNRKLLEGVTTEEFLVTRSSKSNKSNFEVIVENYTEELKKKYEEDIKANKVNFIVWGTVVGIPSSSVSAIFDVPNSDLFATVKDIEAYYGEKQLEIMEGFSYTRAEWNGGVIKNKRIGARVWIAFPYQDKNYVLYDVSAFVSSINTSKSMSSGGFNLSMVYTRSTTDLMALGGRQFISEHSFSGNMGNNQFISLFDCLPQNSLVFIRLENSDDVGDKTTLDNNKEENNVLAVRNGDLKSGLHWDMIGLVDNVNINVMAQSTDMGITITGQDLTKLFNEDGSYFIPLKFVQGAPDQWFWGGDTKNTWFQRNMITGNFDYFFTMKGFTLKEWIWFVIDMLSNVGICPDSLLENCAVRNKKVSLPQEVAVADFDDNVYGIWKIIRAFVDEGLDDRCVVDKTLANPDGTLWDLFKKVLQDPFVEVWADTWGAEFDLIARRPPFTKSALLSILYRQLFISIDKEDVLSFSLGYDETAYAWYRVMPQNSLMVNSQESSLAFCPIVYFDKYVKVFGNKRCVTNDIYLPSDFVKESAEKSQKSSLFAEALCNDLEFVIETTFYLPFTRKGTITINGDRRIKVGTFIKFGPTDELFYVTGVSHDASFGDNGIDWTTTVTVERGMRIAYMGSAEDYLETAFGGGSQAEGLGGKVIHSEYKAKRYEKYKINAEAGNTGVDWTYWDIIDLDALKDSLKKTIVNQDSDKSNAGASLVREGAFDFFYSRSYIWWELNSIVVAGERKNKLNQ